MAKSVKVSAKIIDVWHKSVSYYGNPSKWVEFETANGDVMRGFTANNASCGYGVSNYLNKVVEIEYHITRNGSLIIDYIRERK